MTTELKKKKKRPVEQPQEPKAPKKKKRPVETAEAVEEPQPKAKKKKKKVDWSEDEVNGKEVPLRFLKENQWFRLKGVNTAGSVERKIEGGDIKVALVVQHGKRVETSISWARDTPVVRIMPPGDSTGLNIFLNDMMTEAAPKVAPVAKQRVEKAEKPVVKEKTNSKGVNHKVMKEGDERPTFQAGRPTAAIDAVLVKAKKPMTAEEIADAAGVELGRCKGHLAHWVAMGLYARSDDKKFSNKIPV